MQNRAQCLAILEDPKQQGRQFVVSKAGHAQTLNHTEDQHSFFSAWNADLNFNKKAFPTIQHLFYVAYEAGELFESLAAPKQAMQGPLIWRHQPTWSVCFSPEEQLIYLSSTSAEAELDDLQSWLKEDVLLPEAELSLPDEASETVFDYQQAVQNVKGYIQAGDIFQANIARFWHKPCTKKNVDKIYTKLRAVNPAPFSCLVDMGEMSIVSASPERLFSMSSDGEVSARPIAGTRKRSEGEADDALQAELLLSEKERAEHIMLVDLERNDLGRVCEAGSIHVDECMVIEKYATVQHIVSNVRGKLDAKYSMLDVLAAKFPGGTITGCPKVRCMEIIHELEPQPREVYTGGIGYMAWDGSVDMNILIRTFWHQNATLHWAAGAGIVADSVPEHEQVETEHKVAGLLRVFE